MGVDQMHRPRRDRGCQREDLRVLLLQAALGTLKFLLTAAALREFHVSDGGNPPWIYLGQSGLCALLAASQPDQHIRINQDHAGQNRGARRFRT